MFSRLRIVPAGHPAARLFVIHSLMSFRKTSLIERRASGCLRQYATIGAWQAFHVSVDTWRGAAVE
ncbi:hypothetical protein SADO_14143 [Salinisphaera dokdonensis CL-ES53]|uniref:Uncharacterized protein n=1 Tax=Salinisphaera dokdonensis CL-ES53 TaxID=1304272 RepID=A0ABV2B4C9_9GAMM